MRPSDIAAKYDNRPGFNLVSYAEVGLPIFRITASVLIQEQKSFAPIDEFVMRAIEAGLTEIYEISGFLGLEVSVIEAAISNLIGDTQAIQAPDGTVRLSAKGKSNLAKEVLLRPSTETIIFDVDGLTRDASWYGAFVREPRDLKELGLPEIRAVPARRPEIHELQVEDVDRAFKLASVRQGPVKAPQRTILRVREIFKARRLFYDGVALVFRSEIGEGVQMAFAIDGRLSEEHEIAFAKAGGVAKLGIERSILADNNLLSFEDILGKNAPSKLVDKLKNANFEDKKFTTKLSVAKLKVDVSLKKLGGAEKQNERVSLEQNYQAAVNELDNLRRQLDGIPVRTVPVYEHPVLLHDAIETAYDRLLIISPWITRGVVNREFLSKLRSALERNVELTIIYGLNERNNGEPKRDKNTAESDLIKLSNEFSNFKLMRVGDTHAKVLIKDSEFYVVTSFNWLSFRGDPNRTFREEWGTKVSLESQVNSYYEQLMQRLESE